MRANPPKYGIPNKNLELWVALLAIICITVIYLVVTLNLKAIPNARGVFGHSIGVFGFLLMVMTETLYSVRKRSRIARWGKMSNWLKFHIITGIVGPYMVLLHTSWKFNGLAGVLVYFTIIVVFSGFIGRYIYTAIPRTADGVELEVNELSKLILVLETDIAAVQSLHERQKHLSKDLQKQLQRLVRRQSKLQKQIASLARSRRLMALWHTIHIPIGMLVFTTALFHIVAAIYYATLIR